MFMQRNNATVCALLHLQPLNYEKKNGFCGGLSVLLSVSHSVVPSVCYAVSATKRLQVCTQHLTGRPQAFVETEGFS
jgi:hypothetical protein